MGAGSYFNSSRLIHQSPTTLLDALGVIARLEAENAKLVNGLTAISERGHDVPAEDDLPVNPMIKAYRDGLRESATIADAGLHSTPPPTLYRIENGVIQISVWHDGVLSWVEDVDNSYLHKLGTAYADEGEAQP